LILSRHARLDPFDFLAALGRSGQAYEGGSPLRAIEWFRL